MYRRIVVIHQLVMNTSFLILWGLCTVTLFSKIGIYSILWYSRLICWKPHHGKYAFSYLFSIKCEFAQLTGFHLCLFMFPFPLLIWLLASCTNLRNWGSVDTNRYPQPIICYGITYGFWMLRSRHIGRPSTTVRSWYIAVTFLWGSHERHPIAHLGGQGMGCGLR